MEKISSVRAQWGQMHKILQGKTIKLILKVDQSKNIIMKQ